MVKVLKNRFQEMYKLRDKSERWLGLEIEKEPKDRKGRIAYRSLQRCIANGEMNEDTLWLCAEKLKCHPDYLTGKKNVPLVVGTSTDKEVVNNPLDNLSFQLSDDVKRTDSNGIYVGTFEEAMDDYASELFYEWAEIVFYHSSFRFEDENGNLHPFKDYEKDREDMFADMGIPIDDGISLVNFIHMDTIDIIRKYIRGFYAEYNLKHKNPKRYKKVLRERRKKYLEANALVHSLTEIAKQYTDVFFENIPSEDKEMKNHDEEEQ